MSAKKPQGILEDKRIMCHIPGAWHDPSTVNITVKEIYQDRKKKSCP